MYEIEMDQFLLDLTNAEELPEMESPWYVAVGGKAAVIIAAATR